MGNEIGMGSFFWIFVNELFPSYVRSAGNSLVVAALCLTNGILTFVLPSMFEAMGLGGVFILFLFLAASAGVNFYFFAPNTEGVEIDEAYKKVAISCNASFRSCGSVCGWLLIEDDDAVDDVVSNVERGSSDISPLLSESNSG